MVRNKQVLLTLVTILALASFGFTSFNAVSAGSGGSNSVAVQSLPAASTSLTTTSSNVCDSDDKDTDDCSEGENDGDADENLANVKVGPQEAGICALYKLPAGTTVDSVSGVFAELSFPYYQVDLHFGNYSYTRFINATNCAIVPNPS